MYMDWAEGLGSEEKLPGWSKGGGLEVELDLDTALSLWEAKQWEE